jgi:hypothetical protein
MKQLALLLLLAVALGAVAAESLVARLLRVAGLTVAPQTRAPGDEAEAGNIWIVNVDQRTAKALTTQGGYRSPLFAPAGGAVYALKGENLVRVAVEGGSPVLVQKVPGVVKLAGFDRSASDELVLLLDPVAASSPLAVLSLKSGKMTLLAYDGRSAEQRLMLEQVRAQDRAYGDTSLVIRTETKRGLSRAMEWTDVYLQHGNAPPQNISVCNGVNCTQPALSPDGRTVAFVKAE